MKPPLLAFPVLAALAAGTSLVATPARGDQALVSSSAASDLLRRMVAVNERVHTYKARIHIDTAMKSFPYFSPSLDGNVYYKQPDKQAVVFDTVPAVATAFKKLYPKFDPPSTWAKIYSVTPIADEGGTMTFRLIPKKNGRVEHLDVKVDETTATVKSNVWTYKDGGSITFDQTYKAADGNYLVDRQTGHVDLPSYKVDMTSVLSDYKLNVPVDDAIFVEKK